MCFKASCVSCGPALRWCKDAALAFNDLPLFLILFKYFCAIKKNKVFCFFSRELPFLELTFTSRSFLYKQVCSSYQIWIFKERSAICWWCLKNVAKKCSRLSRHIICDTNVILCCAAGAEDDWGPGGCRPGEAVCAPAEGDIGSSRLSGLPTGSGCSSPGPLPHPGGLQRDRWGRWG